MASTPSASTLTRRVAFSAAAVAVIGMGGLTACSSGSKDKPADTPSQSSPASPTSNSPQPTEKAVSPGGNSSFSPTVKARPAPTALPGNVVTGG